MHIIRATPDTETSLRIAEVAIFKRPVGKLCAGVPQMGYGDG